MRQHKYRAWDKELKRYLPDEFVNQLFLRCDGKLMWWGALIGFEDVSERFDIEFSTGLLDKAGMDIFEGDILKSHGQVVWNDDEYRWSAIDLTWNDKREWHDIDYLTSPFEIIGNIYQDSHLLNEK